MQSNVPLTEPATVELLAYEGIAHLAIRGRIVCNVPLGIKVSAKVPKGTLICPHCRHIADKAYQTVLGK